MSNAALAVQPVAQTLDIHPVAGRIGAEIRGIKLSGDLDAATVDAIQQALVQYKVIFSVSRPTSMTRARKLSLTCSVNRSPTRPCRCVTARVS